MSDNQEKKQNKKLEWVKKHLPEIAFGTILAGGLTALGIQTFNCIQTQNTIQREVIAVADVEKQKHQAMIDLLVAELDNVNAQVKNKE